MKFAIVIERGARNYSAYAPDLPGCAATGKTLDDVKREMRSAIKEHVASLRSHGEVVPEPTTDIDYAEVA